MTIGSLLSDLRFFSNQQSTYSGLPLEDSIYPVNVSVCVCAKMEATHRSNLEGNEVNVIVGAGIEIPIGCEDHQSLSKIGFKGNIVFLKTLY
jgi:hypothetical protein